MFPADEESEKSHREMMATKPKRLPTAVAEIIQGRTSSVTSVDTVR